MAIRVNLVHISLPLQRAPGAILELVVRERIPLPNHGPHLSSRLVQSDPHNCGIVRSLMGRRRRRVHFFLVVVAAVQGFTPRFSVGADSTPPAPAHAPDRGRREEPPARRAQAGRRGGITIRVEQGVALDCVYI